MDIKPVAWYDDDLEIHYGPTHPVFTVTGWKPLYPESALTQAREEGRREGMREAADICNDNPYLNGVVADAKFISQAITTAVNEALESAAMECEKNKMPETCRIEIIKNCNFNFGLSVCAEAIRKLKIKESSNG